MGTPSVADLSLQHLEAELVRIDAMLRRQVERWQAAGQDPADAFRGLYVSDEQADALLTRPFGTSWGQAGDQLPAGEELMADDLEQATRRAEALAQAARQQGSMVRLERLERVFDLDRFDVDTLLICLAPGLDLRYERLYGYLQDDVTRKRPSVNLVLDLLCEPGPGRLSMLPHFADDAPLFKYHVLEREIESGAGRQPLLAHSLSIDDTIVAWLLGKYQPHANLGAHVELSLSPGNSTDVSVSSEVWGHLVTALRENSITVFYGLDHARQRAAAGQMAAQSGRPLLLADVGAVIDSEISPLRSLEFVFRDARLTGAIPFLYGWDTCLVDGAPPPDMLAELCAFPRAAIVAGHSPWQPKGVGRDRNLRWFEFSIPNFVERRALWEHCLAAVEPSAALDVRPLAGQFLLTAGQIRDVVASARDAALQRGDSLGEADLFAAARTHSNPRLAALARKIVPRYGWQDIILPNDQLALLHELIATVRERPQVLEEWGVGQKLASSRGVTVLFAGPPGTGKTMAAEIIASELGLDLYKIDLSTIVSKYIGETEKNLERIFNEATTSNAILFFDEADALFGKRSEVRDSHDRYANIEISYLLQRMEAYDGVTILATNLRANLDEAFTRRLQFAVDFPFPEEEDRLRIWETLFPVDVPRVEELDFDLLARRFKLAGGSIRNILVSAAFLAASDGKKVTMDHLLHGTRRELQKMGRLVAEEDVTAG